MSDLSATCSSRWIALVIGNSRLHWAWFDGSVLLETWDTPHWQADAIASPPFKSGWEESDLWLASVVPHQSNLWQTYPHAHCITLDHIPLEGLYPTLGVDRALALWGALVTWGAPALVIDAGTALTFTGAHASGHLVGGAILPGVQLQLRSLSQTTAALPSLAVQNWASLPPRWARTTPDAICSGVLYTVVAGVISFVEAWMQQFPGSVIALTGGDGEVLLHALTQVAPAFSDRVIFDPSLIFRGISAIRQHS